MTPEWSWYVWMGFFVYKSQIRIFLSSHDTIFVAVGENSQYLTQFSWLFKVYWSLLSIVDQIFTNLSSPQVESNRPSQLKFTPLIRALWAFIKDTYFTFVLKSTSQNFKDSSLEADTNKFPFGLNFKSCICPLWPMSLLGGTFLFTSQSKITLSIPAEATYLHAGCRSSDIIDYLCPFKDRIKQGSS